MSEYGYWEHGFEQDSVRKTEAERNILYDNYKILENKYQQLKQQLQLERDNVAELNELLISYKEENEELKNPLEKEEEYNVKIAQKSVDVNGKLQQKLEKIKEIVSNNNYNGLSVSHYYVKNVKKLILQIIEE